MNDRLRNSNEIDRYITIYSCDILSLWDLPITHLIKQLHLPLQTDNEERFLTLGQCFNISVQKNFPLLKNKTLSTQSILQCVKEKKLHGLLKISGNFDIQSTEKLANLKPFSSLSHDGKMQNSYSLDNELISSSFLNFLIAQETPNSLTGFQVTNIHDLWIWPQINSNPYKELCQKVMSYLGSNETDKQYKNILKSLTNVFIGMKAFSPKNHPISHLVTQEHFRDLTQIKNLKCTENVGPGVILAHFNSTQSFFNNSHNHIAIIHESRKIFIKMYLDLRSFLSINHASSNSDGLLGFSPDKLKTSGRGFSKEPILALDSTLLKSRLSRNDLIQYIALKNRYFRCPLVCPLHHDAYLDCLMADREFIPETCCKDHISLDNYPHKLSIKAYGDRAVVFQINKNIVHDRFTDTVIIKHSGSRQRDIDSFFSKNPDSKKLFLSENSSFTR